MKLADMTLAERNAHYRARNLKAAATRSRQAKVRAVMNGAPCGASIPEILGRIDARLKGERG